MAVPKQWITIRPRWLPFSYRLDRRVPLVALVLLGVTLISLILSISYGEYSISPLDVARTLLNLNQNHPDYANFSLVVFTFRLPRIVLAFLVGAALGTSGTLMQGITRNPLADPFLLGVSSGASLAAVTVIVLWKNIPISWLPLITFAGAAVTALAIYVLAWKGGNSSTFRLILVGIALEALTGAAITTIIVFGNILDVQQAYIWLSGSVYGRNWEHVRAIAGWLLIFIPLAILLARQLNILNLGDETAKGLGLRVEWQRGLLLFVSVALAASAVAVAGAIGFVGLIAPHITRRLVGPSHEGVVPISALFGGTLLVIADLIGRMVVSPSELPVGLVTAMIGAPYFLYLFYRQRNQ